MRTVSHLTTLALWSVCALATVSRLAAVEVTTQHFDNARSGANTSESALTTGNVATATFGKLFTVIMNADVNGQALYMPGLTINSAVHNTVFVYSSYGYDGSPCGLYAFDADTGGAALWSRTLTNTAQYTTNTPVIDSAAKTMFFVSKDNNNEGINWLHAVDLLTGAEKPGSPAQISGSVPGIGDGAAGGVVTFPATHANCRPGLLLVNGVLYLGFSFNSDGRPYHGWVLSYTYNGAAFVAQHIFCVSPNKEAGGIWQAGKGLASDGTFVFCTTGNGSFDNNLATGSAFGMCFLKLNSNLQVVDYFAEANESPDSNGDQDLGSVGNLLIPGSSVLFAGGSKYGRGHLVDATNMGHFTTPTDACLQTVSTGLGNAVGQNPVAWNGGAAGTFVYCWSNGHGVAQFKYSVSAKHFVDGAGVNTGAPLHTGAAISGGSMCLSSNGTANGILWATGNDGVVHAYDATDVTHELWNSNQNSARDALPSAGHFQFPMVANGKVYVPTGGNNRLVAYGLLNVQVATKLGLTQQPSTTSAGSVITPAVTVTVQDAGGATVVGSSAPVTLAIGANPGSGILSGTTTVNAVNGVATFSNLSINNAGTGYTLTANSAGLAGAASAAFNVVATVATPTINPNGGSYSGPVTVLLNDATAGAIIHFTTDGSTPTGTSTTYNPASPPAISASATLKAIGTKSGFSDSAVASAAFTITGSTPYGMPFRPTISGLNVPPTNTSPPLLLSSTNVFASLASLSAANGIVPYNVNTPLWSDAAIKSRWIALPGTSQVAFQATGEWSFPGGTILVKHFELGTDDTNPAIRKRLETRLLVLNASGTNGYGITYRWRADNSDADLLSASGLDEAITISTGGSGTRTQTWHYPSQTECLTCHTTNAGFVLGVKTRQLNGAFAYPSTGISDNQLRTWNYLQMFSTNIGESNISGFTRTKAIGDTTATLEDRVKSYVDANCAQCHRPGGVVTAWDARYDTPMANQAIIDGLVKIDLGIPGAKVVSPRNIGRSLLHFRMNSVDPTNKMPPLARNVIDATAVSTIASWINGLPLSPQVATPTLSPNGGTFAGSAMITLSTGTSGASIRYTTDGTTPTSTTGTVYGGAFALNASGTVGAIAYSPNMGDSAVTSAAFTITSPAVTTPTISPNGGTFAGSMAVTLATTTSGASIRYTTDGSTPTSTVGTLYAGAFTLTTNATVRAIAFKAGIADSTVASAAFTINATPPAGLTAQYWTNQDKTFTGTPTLTRIDPTVNFNWGNGSPDPSISGDHFTARWTGQVQAQFSETYTFFTYSDDGVRLWVNGQLIIDKWIDQVAEWSGTIALSAGQKYTVQMDYYENAGGAVAQLSWSSPSTAKQIIPQAQLFPTASSQAPTVATAASASPNPVSGSTTALSVLGADDGGEAALIYTWATTGTPPAAVAFSANGTNAARSSTATFSKAGSYTLQATIRDADGLTVASSVTVAVNQTLAGISVSPASATVVTNATQAFTASATDQFGAIMASQPAPAWTANGGGTINAAGVFTAGATAGGPFTVTASGSGKSGTASVTVVTSSTGSGLTAQYWTNQDKTFAGTPTLTRIDPTVNFNWGNGSPDPSISGDHFTARWTGQVQAQFSETYTFFTYSDDGVRLWLNGQLLIDKWIDQGPTEWNGTLALSAGQKYDVKMEFYENAGGAVAQLSWSSPSTAKQIIPQAQLFPVASSQTPTVATAAAATPNPVAGSTTALSVLGADDGGEAALTYTWATTGSPPAAVAFSANGTNAAKNTTATFTKAGSYTLQATIRDAGGLTVASSVTVTVNQTLTAIAVLPASVTVVTNATQAFTASATDQFGAIMASQPALAWTASGGGTVNATGVFTAGATAGGPFTVTASGSGKSGTASVTVVTSSTGSGLTAQYWTNQDKTFTGTPTLTRIDPTVNFNWGNGSPDPSISGDHFTARWTGQAQAQFSETYTFFTYSDDGVRLWVNGQLLIDKWVDQGAEWSGTIALSAGQKYTVQMDYYENAGGATAQLSWSSPSTAKQIIPQVQLFPAASSQAPTGSSLVVEKSVSPPGAASNAGGVGCGLGGLAVFVAVLLLASLTRHRLR